MDELEDKIHLYVQGDTSAVIDSGERERERNIICPIQTAGLICSNGLWATYGCGSLIILRKKRSYLRGDLGLEEDENKNQ